MPRYFTWNVALFADLGHASVGRYRSRRRAMRSFAGARMVQVGDYGRMRHATIEARSCDEVIAKLPEVFPAGVNIQSMDVEARIELDPLTDEPTGRDLTDVLRGAQ
jgi:hypothetical protein